jgi:hypothetical protein
MQEPLAAYVVFAPPRTDAMKQDSFVPKVVFDVLRPDITRREIAELPATVGGYNRVSCFPEMLALDPELVRAREPVHSAGFGMARSGSFGMQVEIDGQISARCNRGRTRNMAAAQPASSPGG